MDKFSVAIHHNNDNGYLEFDAASKTVKVVLADSGKKAAVEKYLAATHQFKVAGSSLMDFIDVEIDPLADVESLKIALTRMWGHTGVYVDWSRPVEYYKAQ